MKWSLTAFLRRFGGYLLVGTTCAGLFFILSVLLTDVVGINPTLSSFLAYSICVPISYVGQRALTFKTDLSQRVAFTRFVITSIIAMINTPLIVKCGLLIGLSANVSFLAVCVLVPMINYWLYAVWVFQVKKKST